MNRLAIVALACLLAVGATSWGAAAVANAADPSTDPAPTDTAAPDPGASASLDPGTVASPDPASPSPSVDPSVDPSPTPASTPEPIPSATPSPAPSPSPSPVPPPAIPPMSTTTNPPTCRILDRSTRYRAYTDYQKTLLDWIYRLSGNYAPTDLVPVSRAGLTGSGSVRRLVIPDLTAMTRAARAAGAPIAVASAFRSYGTQIAVFNSWIRSLGYSHALSGSARPGHSEHQLGTTIDFKSYRGSTPWSFGGYDWAQTRAGAWMKANAWKYGFVMSYPRGRTSQVCYGYEPWHYRYYGRPVARAIHMSGLTPRYWLWKHGSNQ